MFRFEQVSGHAFRRELLEKEQAGLIVRTGVLFEEAAAEWLRYVEEDRAIKPTTLRDYRQSVRNRIVPFFVGVPVEQVTPQAIEVWRSQLNGGPRTKNNARLAAEAFAVASAHPEPSGTQPIL